MVCAAIICHNDGWVEMTWDCFKLLDQILGLFAIKFSDKVLLDTLREYELVEKNEKKVIPKTTM